MGIELARTLELARPLTLAVRRPVAVYGAAAYSDQQKRDIPSYAGPSLATFTSLATLPCARQQTCLW